MIRAIAARNGRCPHVAQAGMVHRFLAPVETTETDDLQMIHTIANRCHLLALRVLLITMNKNKIMSANRILVTLNQDQVTPTLRKSTTLRNHKESLIDQAQKMIKELREYHTDVMRTPRVKNLHQIVPT